MAKRITVSFRVDESFVMSCRFSPLAARGRQVAQALLLAFRQGQIGFRRQTPSEE
jgi:hypothetical protein